MNPKKDVEMMNRINKENSFVVRHWWISLVLGVLYVMLAIWLLLNPLVSYLTLSMLFSIFMLVSGIFEIIFALFNRKNKSCWGWYLAGGFIDLIVGIMLISIPGLSASVLPLILALWLMFRGVSGIGYSIELRRNGIRNWGWDMALSILAVFFSIGIIWLPVAGALTFVFITAYAFLFLGAFRIMLSIRLKDMHKSQVGHDSVVRL